jgi:hypothetical protein
MRASVGRPSSHCAASDSRAAFADSTKLRPNFLASSS